MRLKEYIQTKRIIADGAFGTYYMSLYGDGSKPEKGLAISNLPELANITAPERVHSLSARIHLHQTQRAF